MEMGEMRVAREDIERENNSDIDGEMEVQPTVTQMGKLQVR